jgi:hypothetical protein
MPEHDHDLAVEVKEAIDAWRAGPVAGESTLAWVTRSTEATAEAAHALALGYEGDRTELVAKATELALHVFDKYVVDYDVPNVGPLVETWVESAVRGAIPTLVAEAFDKLPKAA